MINVKPQVSTLRNVRVNIPETQVRVTSVTSNYKVSTVDLDSHADTCVLSVCGPGLRDLESYSLLGGGVPNPEHRLRRSVGYVPI